MENRWYRRTPVIIALLVFFFPAGLYLMWRYVNWGKKTKWIITGVFAIFLILGSSSSKKSTTTPAPTPQPAEKKEEKPTEIQKPTKHEFDAEVRFSEIAFQIKNNESSNWTDCRLELNSGILKGGYIYKTALISPQDPLIVPFREFTKGDGTRFNSYDTKPQSLSISCKVDGVSGFGYYAIN